MGPEHSRGRCMDLTAVEIAEKDTINYVRKGSLWPNDMDLKTQTLILSTNLF